MLHLVLAHRHEIGAIQQNVRRLQDGIVQQPRIHALLPLRFLLELCLPLQLAKGGDGVEDPLQLGMFLHGRLHEQRRDVRIDAGGQQRQCHLAPPHAQLVGIVRHRDGMVVDDADDGRLLMLQPHPVPDGPEVIADVEFARGLDSAEDARHFVKV